MVNEWLSQHKNKQFKMVKVGILDSEREFAQRIKDGAWFCVKDLVTHSSGYKLIIYYFCNDGIHFMMENGMQWQANDIIKNRV